MKWKWVPEGHVNPAVGLVGQERNRLPARAIQPPVRT